MDWAGGCAILGYMPPGSGALRGPLRDAGVTNRELDVLL
jgi:hypothetical protein